MPYRKPVKISQNHVNVANVMKKNSSTLLLEEKRKENRHRMDKHGKQEMKNLD